MIKTQIDKIKKRIGSNGRLENKRIVQPKLIKVSPAKKIKSEPKLIAEPDRKRKKIATFKTTSKHNSNAHSIKGHVAPGRVIGKTFKKWIQTYNGYPNEEVILALFSKYKFEFQFEDIITQHSFLKEKEKFNAVFLILDNKYIKKASETAISITLLKMKNRIKPSLGKEGNYGKLIYTPSNKKR